MHLMRPAFRAAILTVWPEINPCPARGAPRSEAFLASRSGAPQMRDRQEHRVCGDPGSAAHHFVLRCARETQEGVPGQALRCSARRVEPPRIVTGTARTVALRGSLRSRLRVTEREHPGQRRHFTRTTIWRQASRFPRAATDRRRTAD